MKLYLQGTLEYITTKVDIKIVLISKTFVGIILITIQFKKSVFLNNKMYTNQLKSIIFYNIRRFKFLQVSVVYVN